MRVGAVAVAFLLSGCGAQPTDESGGRSATTATTATAAAPPTTVAGRAYAADLTTTDGNRYKVTVLVGSASPTGAPDGCPGTATPGRFYLPVTVTVANEASDRPAPFPPLRIEMTTGPGAKPAPVLVREPAGSCTFAPRVPSIGPGASVVFKGTTPAIDEGAAAGSAGRIEVNVSETRFSLAAPVP